MDDTVVPPRSECLVPANLVYRNMSVAKHSDASELMTESAEPVKGIHVSHTLVRNDSLRVPVRLMNSTTSPITLKARMVLADVSPVETFATIEDSSAVSPQNKDAIRYDEMLDSLVSGVNEDVSHETRHELRKLLKRFEKAFSLGENDLGSTNVTAHEIDTGDAKPVRQSLRRYPPAHMEAIREHVASMMEQDVIEPAQSAWASNLVLVRKKDGSLRCCVDYRQLNASTRKVAYPLPRTDMCLDAMSGARWFSTFDLRSSYHQVPVVTKDADKTAFICREGMFRFKKMPFGLCNAGATFQRLMDLVLSGLSPEICLAYIDDVIIFSSDESSHLERLEAVLDRLTSAGLKLKPSKCSLLQRSVSFLGHIISAEGIATDPRKVSDITGWPVPRNVKEVRAFVGICGYYRRYVENFASIAKPLYQLTEKNHKFEWTADCETAFERLKAALTSPPVLGMPNDTDPFVLDTDASNWAIGAVLSQKQEGTERVIAYASRKLSKAEMNYCVTRRELLAIVFFLKYFRHYLLGRPFLVRTDHAALQWLRRTPEVMGQQARWLNTMEEYDFTVMHRPGSRHGNADAMSRLPCVRADCCENEKLQFDVRAVTEQPPGYSNWVNDSATLAKFQDEDERVNSVDLLHEIAKPLCCTVSKTPSGATSQVAACEADDQATAKGTAPLPSKEERLEKYAKQGFIVRKKSTTSHGDSTRAEERQPPQEEKAMAIKNTHKRPANKDHTERSATDESAKRNKNCEVPSQKSSAERNHFPRFPAGKCEPRLEQRDDHWRMTARFGGQPMRRPGGGRGFTNGGRRQRDRGPTVRSTSWLSACKRW